MKLLYPVLVALGALLVPDPARGAEGGDFVLLAAATRTSLELRVEPAVSHHLADDYPARLVLRTQPETELDDDIDLAGRVSELSSGLSIALPAKRPLVVDGELEIGVCDAAGTCTPWDVGFQVLVRNRKPTIPAPVEVRSIQRVKSREDLMEAVGEDTLRLAVRAASLDGGLRAALNEAEGRADPLLAVFKTRWCPPCRRMQVELLDDPAYAPLLDRFARVTFDADRANSWEAKSRWAVGGYPTIVVCSYDGDLVWRHVGFEDAESLAAELDALADRLDEEPPVPIEGELTPDAALRLATRSEHRQDREGVLAWLAQVPDGAGVDPLALLEARVFLARTDPQPATAATALEALLMDHALEPIAPPEQQAWWWYRVARLRDEAGEPVLEERAWDRTRATAEQWLTADLAPTTAAEAWSLLALARDELGDVEGAAAASSAAADQVLIMLGGGGGAAMDVAVVQGNPGRVMQLVPELVKAGRADEARAVLDIAVAAMPEEAPLLQLRAWAERELGGDLERAALDVAAAYGMATGDNRLRAADLWTGLLVDLGRPDEAAARIREVLEGLRLPEDPAIRTHRYARALTERLAELERDTDRAEP